MLPWHLVCGQERERLPDPVRPEVESSYTKGLAYLVANQTPEGCWRDQYGRYPGVVGLAVMAMLAHGDDPIAGPYHRPLSQSLTFILSKQNPDTGFIGDSMYNHGFATVALAEAYGTVENEELALRLSQRASEDSTRALAALTIAEAKLKIQLEATETATKAEPANFTSAGFATDGSTLALGRSQGGTLLYNNVGEHWLGTISDDPATPLAAFSGNLWLAARDKSLQCSKVDESWSWSRTIGSIDDPKQLIDRVTALAFSPNGTVLATGSGSPSRSGELKLWRVSDGSPLLEVTDAHSDTIVGLEFSPDGQYLATASTDRFAKVFRVSDGALVTAFEGHTSHVLDVTWRADGLVLATAGADNVIKLWDFEEKRQIKTIDGYTQEITSVSFADNAEKLVTSSGDKSVRVGNERLDGKEFVYASALSQDGEWLIAGTQDSVVRVWQAKDKKLVQEFTAPGK